MLIHYSLNRGNYSTGFGEEDPKARWKTDGFGQALGKKDEESSSSSSSSSSPSPSSSSSSSLSVGSGGKKMERVQSVYFKPTQTPDYDAKLPVCSSLLLVLLFF